MAGIIRWKLFVRDKFHTHEVANGVPIFRPIEPSNRHLAGIRIGWIHLKHRGLDPRIQLLLLRRTGLRILRRWHDARANILERPQPQIPFPKHRLFRGEPIQDHPALVHPVSVAIMAKLTENRLNCFLELCNGSGVGLGGCLRVHRNVGTPDAG